VADDKRQPDFEKELLRERFAMRSLLEFTRTLTPDLGIEGIIRSVERTVMEKDSSPIATPILPMTKQAASAS
jgi:hypothetical protein